MTKKNDKILEKEEKDDDDEYVATEVYNIENKCVKAMVHRVSSSLQPDASL